MTDNNKHTFTAMKVSQPIGDFFIAKIPFEVITECASSDIRRITERDIETMSGIQRVLKNDRVVEIQKYVKTIDAAFPNSIILSMDTSYCDYSMVNIKIEKKENTNVEITNVEIANAENANAENASAENASAENASAENASAENINAEVTNAEIYIFELEINKKVFKIIDGQHRLAGLEKVMLERKELEFEVIIAFYLDLPIDEQAYMFSTINLKQTKVSKSLVMDLFGLSKKHTPERCAHLVTKSLNTNKESPLYRRISMLGVAPRFKGEILYKHSLTQGNVAGKILDMISKDPKEDRDKILRNHTIDYDYWHDIDRNLIFRDYFRKEETDTIIKILLNYFRAIEFHFNEEWNAPKNPLSKAIGFRALMKFLLQAFKQGIKKDDLTIEYFKGVFQVLRKNYDSQNEFKLDFDHFHANGIGENELYKKLLEWSELSDKSEL